MPRLTLAMCLLAAAISSVKADFVTDLCMFDGVDVRRSLRSDLHQLWINSLTAITNKYDVLKDCQRIPGAEEVQILPAIMKTHMDGCVDGNDDLLVKSFEAFTKSMNCTVSAEFVHLEDTNAFVGGVLGAVEGLLTGLTGNLCGMHGGFLGKVICPVGNLIAAIPAMVAQSTDDLKRTIDDAVVKRFAHIFGEVSCANREHDDCAALRALTKDLVQHVRTDAMDGLLRCLKTSLRNEDVFETVCSRSRLFG